MSITKPQCQQLPPLHVWMIFGDDFIELAKRESGDAGAFCREYNEHLMRAGKELALHLSAGRKPVGWPADEPLPVNLSSAMAGAEIAKGTMITAIADLPADQKRGAHLDAVGAFILLADSIVRQTPHRTFGRGWNDLSQWEPVRTLPGGLRASAAAILLRRDARLFGIVCKLLSEPAQWTDPCDDSEVRPAKGGRPRKAKLPRGWVAWKDQPPEFTDDEKDMQEKIVRELGRVPRATRRLSKDVRQKIKEIAESRGVEYNTQKEAYWRMMSKLEWAWSGNQSRRSVDASQMPRDDDGGTIDY